MSLFAVASLNPAGHRDLSVSQLQLPPAATVRIIDVREPHEFTGELGHIPGAVLVPLSTVMAQAQSWDRSLEYVIVCRSGGRSANAAMALHRAGFNQVMNLVGGMLHWNSAGLKTER